MTPGAALALPPGVLDMKAGLVQMFHALACLPSPDGMRVLVNGDEEVGSPTSRELNEESALGCAAAFLLEAAANEEGALKTHLWLDHTPGDLTRAPGMTALTTFLENSNLGSHVRRVLTEMTGETADLNQRIRALESVIRELVAPLTPALLEITGISHVSAAVLLAEIGDIPRFSSSAKLARYTGCAPIPVYSSDKERNRLHRGGNRRLNSVLYTTAIVQQRFHPGARELLARHTPTKGARGARRILKRHLIDVIHRAMVRDRASWQHHIAQHQLTA